MALKRQAFRLAKLVVGLYAVVLLLAGVWMAAVGTVLTGVLTVAIAAGVLVVLWKLDAITQRLGRVFDKRRLAADDRGLAIGLISFFAILVMGALMYTMFQPAASGVFDASLASAESTEATEAIELRQQIWGLILFAVIFIAGLQIIARAIFESRRGV